MTIIRSWRVRVPKYTDVAAVVAVAFAVRAWFTHGWLNTVFGEVPFLDARAYDQWARAIAGGDWVNPPVFYQSPLYPYVLAVSYGVLGLSPAGVAWAQAALGAITCGVLADVTRARFGRWAGLGAGLLAAFDRSMVFYGAPLMKETLGLFLLALFAWSVERPTRRAATGAGVALGLAALVRTNALVLVLPVAWLMRRSFVGRFLPFVAAVILSVLPATIHNLVVGGDRVLVNSAGGFNFYIGNGPSAAARAYPPGISTDPAREEADVTRVAEAARGRRLRPSEVSAHWFDAGLSYLRRCSWADLARLYAAKLAWFGANAEIADNYDAAFVAAHVVPALGWASVGFGLLLTLAALGAAGADRGAGGSSALLFVTYAASVIAFYVNDRYRLPAVIFLIPPAGHGLALGARALAGRGGRAVARGAVAAVVAALWAFGPTRADPRDLDGFNWGLVASLNADAGHHDAAVAAIERALAGDPARIDAAAYVKGSTAHETLGNLTRARELLEMAVRAHADDGLTVFNLGRFEYEHGDARAAARLYARAAQISPWLPQPHLGLAILHLRAGRRAAAARAVERGLALAPDHAQLRDLARLVH